MCFLLRTSAFTDSTMLSVLWFVVAMLGSAIHTPTLQGPAILYQRSSTEQT